MNQVFTQGPKLRAGSSKPARSAKVFANMDIRKTAGQKGEA